MPKLSHLTERSGATPQGTWRVDHAWVEHRGAHVRRLPVAVVHAACEVLAGRGGLRPDGTVDPGQVRGVRAHHAEHGRWSVELRGPRWELAWYPRGGSAQRVELAGAVTEVRRQWGRRRATDVAA